MWKFSVLRSYGNIATENAAPRAVEAIVKLYGKIGGVFYKEFRPDLLCPESPFNSKPSISLQEFVSPPRSLFLLNFRIRLHFQKILFPFREPVNFFAKLSKTTTSLPISTTGDLFFRENLIRLNICRRLQISITLSSPITPQKLF